MQRVYGNNPYLSDEFKTDSYTQSFVELTASGIARSIQRAEHIRSTLGVQGVAIMEQVLCFYYAGVDFETHVGSVETAFE
jgi:hypothetical protein